MPTVLILPDLHAPFAHPRALAWLESVRADWAPDTVICIGDLGDQHGWCTHGTNPASPGPATEDERCLAFCRSLYSLFPVVLACTGNHDTRLARKCAAAGIPPRLHRTIAEVYESPPGWVWADHHIVQGVLYLHGEGYSGKDAALRAALDNGTCTVAGHIHSAAGVQYHASLTQTLWGLSVGCLVDPASPAFAYARAHRRKPVLGCGVVCDGVPLFLPLV